MAWRLTEAVLEGELDNTTWGWTIGWIRLRGRSEPLRLKLAGNCHRDLAGWRFRIVRTESDPECDEPNDWTAIVTDQSGIIGDVTADQVLQHYECSTDEFVRLCHERKRPHTMLCKALYLEWFSNFNGRVVIQSTRLAVERLGDRAFELTDHELAEQAKQNREEMTFFLHQLCDALDHQLPPGGND